MLRVGLTGGLGSGKSTVAAMLREHGAHILVSDEIGRALMMRGRGEIYDRILALFGPEVLSPTKELDPGALSRLAFDAGRVEELNRIVHPAVIARQQELTNRIIADDPDAIVVLESALIFETKHGGPGGWRERFDRIVLVTAPPGVRIERYANRRSDPSESPSRRSFWIAEAQRRMKHQMSDEQKIPLSDFVLSNDGSLAELEQRVEALWRELQTQASARA